MVTLRRRIAAVSALIVITGVSILVFGMLILLLPHGMHDPGVRWGTAGVFGVVLGGYAALRIDRVLAGKAASELLPMVSESRAEGGRSVAARDIAGNVVTGNVTDQFSPSPRLAENPKKLPSSKAKETDGQSALTRSIAIGDRSVAARDISGEVITGDTVDS